jgi:hypothetical protein
MDQHVEREAGELFERPAREGRQGGVRLQQPAGCGVGDGDPDGRQGEQRAERRGVVRCPVGRGAGCGIVAGRRRPAGRA